MGWVILLKRYFEFKNRNINDVKKNIRKVVYPIGASVQQANNDHSSDHIIRYYTIATKNP